MSWNDFNGKYMAACQEKATAKLWVYCPKRLQAYFETPPRTGRHILARNMTQPLGKRAAQKAVEDVRAALGLMHGENRLVPREWRYTAARLLAEAGCSNSEIQAVTGHKTLTMVHKYRAQANQRAASKWTQQRRGR
tara:strand:+ start:402 stop:809 length:408 start_codon:yes stop_codon:yes gene_type:complete